MGEMAGADKFANAFEKPLAEGWKTVYNNHRTSRLCSVSVRIFFNAES